jgi:putative peptide zinc metalloprotease protein
MDGTPDDVRRLLSATLFPLGLVRGAGDVVAERFEAPRSPLQVGARLTVLSPERITPVANLLRPLHAPPVVCVVLLAVVATHLWLYARHGIAGALTQAIYQPSLFLAALAILIPSFVAHELGHASALRYGGGRVRSMGIGLYLVWPVFYTDVTDSYRLGRSARVRTDLSGFYFHLLFAAIRVGLYWLTGQEVLLLVVVLIDLDIARQLLPFLRLDGYWTLADLTGVPDFFSQMGPFLRSLRRRRRGPGARLPALRPWSKVAFALYVAVTIPVLGAWLILLVVRLPELVARGRISAAYQLDALTEGWQRAEPLTVIGAGLQLLMLILLPVAIAYSVVRLARALVSRRRRLRSARSPGARGARSGRLVRRGDRRSPRAQTTPRRRRSDGSAGSGLNICRMSDDQTRPPCPVPHPDRHCSSASRTQSSKRPPACSPRAGTRRA